MNFFEYIFSIKNETKHKNKKYKVFTFLNFIKFKFLRKDYVKNLESFQKFVPHGHYYSVLPTKNDIEKYYSEMDFELPNINLNLDFQKQLYNELIDLYKDYDFKENKEDITDGRRYYIKNPTFSYSDGLFLNLFLRKFQPNKIIEIGSGFTSAMSLDTYEYFLDKNINLTCIEPYPKRLKENLKAEDNNRIKIIEKPLQEVNYKEITDNLENGDLLFIDSTHCLKCGSDVMYEFDKLLPNLKSGVYVHFHDIFYPFTYPKEWLEEGRYWNEAFFLKQFLANNNEWEIVLWPNMAFYLWNDFMTQNFPLAAKNIGASIYLRKK